jgi:hypothetical protein
MTSSIVVTYTIKPDVAEEHLRLIGGVFAELRALELDNVTYEVLRLEDGVSFVHVSTAVTSDGVNPMPGLASFQEFSRGLPSRVTAPPAPVPAEVVGSYRPRNGAAN